MIERGPMINGSGYLSRSEYILWFYPLKVWSSEAISFPFVTDFTKDNGLFLFDGFLSIWKLR